MHKYIPFLMLGLVACGGNDFTALTYNAGLATGFVPGAESRAEGTAAATVDIDADVVCLQEVWDPAHVAVYESAATGYESHFPEPSQVSSDEPACEDGEMDNLLTCLDEECGDACDDELVDCLLDNCAGPFILLKSDCMLCAQANVGGSPEEVRANCTEGMTEYAYDGSFGTGILSKHPLTIVDHSVFASTSNRRGLIHAEVELPAGTADVYCTHLTAVFSVIPYPRDEGSWLEEQAVQVQTLVDEVAATSTHDLVVVMGDMNNGPAVRGSVAEEPENYALFDGLGMANPYVDEAGECTFCPDNNLIGADSDDKGVVIDHVFVQGGSGLTPSRVLTEATTAESCGETIDANHSDHYGVLVNVKP